MSKLLGIKQYERDWLAYRSTLDKFETHFFDQRRPQIEPYILTLILNVTYTDFKNVIKQDTQQTPLHANRARCKGILQKNI